jgi:hypothetical protein
MEGLPVTWELSGNNAAFKGKSLGAALFLKPCFQTVILNNWLTRSPRDCHGGALRSTVDVTKPELQGAQVGKAFAAPLSGSEGPLPECLFYFDLKQRMCLPALYANNTAGCAHQQIGYDRAVDLRTLDQAANIHLLDSA